MLANRFFSLSQESQWSDLLDAVGLAEISDDSNEDNQDNEDEDPNVAKDKEDLRLYLVNKLKVSFLSSPKQIPILTIKQIKIATIRGQLTIEGKLRPTGISTIPYQPVADTELIKNKLNAVLAIADGHEELVKSLTNAWLEKRKEDSQGSQDQGE